MVLVLHDMLEVVTCDMMINEIRELVELGHGRKDSGTQLFKKAIDSRPAIAFPPSVTAQWEEQIKRLYLLLAVNESAMDVPKNLEARRRITFFTNSLFMDMPRAPQVRKMLSFRVLLCLKRALRIANAAQQMSNVTKGSSGSVILFIEILNKYLYFFEKGNTQITVASVQGLIELVTTEMQSDSTSSDPAADAFFASTMRYIQSQKEKGGSTTEKFEAIKVV